MNYGFYMDNYSGKYVNIAVIDCGINGNIVDCKKHFIIDENGIVTEINETNKLTDYHGTYCAQEIKKVAKCSAIYDFNVAEKEHSITELRIIKVLEYIIVQNIDIDIISISMKLETFSEQLLDVISEIYNRGIFILAASDNRVSYPADFEYVLAIQSEQCNKDNIMHVNSKTICIQKKEYIYHIHNKNIHLEPSSSLACAYYAGILALVIEGNILTSFEQLCEKLNIFNYEGKDKDNKKNIIEQNTAIIDMSHTVEWYGLHKQLFNKNIIGFFDVISKNFVSMNSCILDEKEIEHVIEINCEHYEKKTMSNQTKFKDIPFQLLGKFETKEKELMIDLNSFEDYNFEYIKYIKKPIIYISGFVCGTQKYETLVRLYEQFSELSINCATMTSNPLGYIMGMSTYEYPKEITYPRIVYQLNEAMDDISYEDEIDMLIVDIPGGISKLNWHNQYNFGMLFNAFLIAADADIIIIMLNQGITWENIRKEAEQLKLKNIPYIIFCVSEYMIDSATVESEQGVQLIKNSEADSEQFYQEALQHLAGYKVFKYQEVINGSMAKYILNLYQ